jgi:tRNA A-37 threonylcarbamoyl transferase component Bud32
MSEFYPRELHLAKEHRDTRISQIINAYRGQLRLENDTDFSKFVAENEDLEPELSQQLAQVLAEWEIEPDASDESAEHDDLHEDPASDRTVVQSTVEGHAESERARVVFDDSSRVDFENELPTKPARTRARRIHCPHCGVGLQLVEDEVAEIVCRGCGSSIPLEQSRTRSRNKLRRQRIGRFETLAVLGQGTFGVVYKARDPAINRLVAIKIPRNGFFHSSSDRERFLREARHAGQLSHANIVRIYEVDEEDGVPFIVSELIDGMTLADICAIRQLEFRESAKIISTVCDAIDDAHQKGLIHRDLKPSNILLDQQLRPHVADFGLARISEAEMTLTMDGEVLGTPAFMSPEQASGSNTKLKPSSDVYSLGVILYRMLTGSLPFRGSQRMLLHQVISEDPKPPRTFNEQIPRDLETITLQAMEKEPARRYASAKLMGADLQRWLNGDPILLDRSLRATKSFDGVEETRSRPH